MTHSSKSEENLEQRGIEVIAPIVSPGGGGESTGLRDCATSTTTGRHHHPPSPDPPPVGAQAPQTLPPPTGNDLENGRLSKNSDFYVKATTSILVFFMLLIVSHY